MSLSVPSMSVPSIGTMTASTASLAANPTASLGAAQFAASLQGELARLAALGGNRHGGSQGNSDTASALPVS